MTTTETSTEIPAATSTSTPRRPTENGRTTDNVIELSPGMIAEPPVSERAGASEKLAESRPPVPERSRSVWRFVPWVVVIALAVPGWYYHSKWWPAVAPYVGLAPKVTAKPPARVIPVVTATVQKKDMEVFINGLGTVTAFKIVTVRSRVEGELVKVAFTEGQMVKENDMLVEIDKRQFEVQLQQAEGQLARDEATLNSAEITLKRYQELLQKKSIAAQQVDEQRALVQQTAGALQSDRANVANARLQLDYCHITAPISGRIGLRLVDQGNIVRANEPLGLAVITQLQPIAVVFTIPQDDISRVQKASMDGHELVVTAYDRNFKTKLATGKLLAIDNQVDATTGTVRLKAVFDNDENLLFPNQFVNARLLVDTKKDAFVIPTAAIQRGPNSTFVYVVQADETVDLRTVTTGLTEGSETAVTSGLQPGEIVVTEGLDKLQKGSPITTNLKEPTKEKGKKGDAGEKSGEKPVEKSGNPSSQKTQETQGHAAKKDSP